MKYILLLTVALMMITISGFGQPQNRIEEKVGPVEKVYPNPVVDHLYISFKLDDYNTARFELLDVLGNTIKQWEAQQLFPGTPRVKLEFQSIRTGIYFLRIYIDGKEVVKRIRKS